MWWNCSTIYVYECECDLIVVLNKYEVIDISNWEIESIDINK